ncbi:MAG TPA: hypothetical protein PKA27_00430 [Fimbriimonadaceae bacterium]|nr:hypothetical protein [Fimbriimonadaceae bacterium]
MKKSEADSNVTVVDRKMGLVEMALRVVAAVLIAVAILLPLFLGFGFAMLKWGDQGVFAMAAISGLCLLIAWLLRRRKGPQA